jgi:hypothetical protein
MGTNPFSMSKLKFFTVYGMREILRSAKFSLKLVKNLNLTATNILVKSKKTLSLSLLVLRLSTDLKIKTNYC